MVTVPHASEPDPETRRAAREAISPSRLLPGEDQDSPRLDDAMHWMTVYSELLAGKARMLDMLLKQLEVADRDETRLELTHDQTIMLAEIERFQKRLRYWHECEMRLRGEQAGPDGELRSGT